MKNKGFTLLETMIYIALFGLIMSGSVVTAYQLLEGGRHNQTAITIQEEGTFLSRKINWALLGATDVTVNGTGKILTITRADLLLESPLTIESASTTMTLKRGGGTAVPLNGDAFAVTDVSFTKTPVAGGIPASLETKFTVNNKPFIFKTYLRQ